MTAAVAAVAPGGAADLDAQTVPVAARAASLEEALGMGCASVWILDAAARPAPDALEQLLAVPEAPVVAGLVTGPGGAPCAPAAPRPAEREVLLAAETVREGRLPIRHAPLVHTLVATDAVRARGGPQLERFGPYAGAEWTARLLAGGHGWWATRSVAVIDPCPPPTVPSLVHRLRMLRSGAWTAAEALEELAGMR